MRKVRGGRNFKKGYIMAYFLNGISYQVLGTKDMKRLEFFSAVQIREKIRRAYNSDNKPLANDLFKYYKYELNGRRTLKEILSRKRGYLK